MAFPQIKSGISTESLVYIDTTSASPSPSDNYWYLRYYTQDYCGHTQLHRYMINLPENNNFTKHLINETWPPSLLDTRNTDGLTALHLGAMRNQPDIVRQLLIAGANPKSKDHFGCIPLHYACKKNNVHMIVALAKAFDEQEKTKMKSKNLQIPDLWSSLHVRNNAGETPLDVATHFGHLDIVKLLFELGADLDCPRFRDRRSPLEIAIMKGHKEITEFILDHHKENSNYMSYYHYWCPELILPLQKMGLDGKFFKMFKLPLDTSIRRALMASYSR